MQAALSRRGLLRSTGAALLSATMAELSGGCARHQAAQAAGGGESAGGDAPAARTQSDEDQPLPLEQRVGVALVGLGKLTLEELLPAFEHCKLARPAALVSGSRDKALKYAQKHGIDASHIYDYASFDRIRDDPAVDVVYVVLPNSMHAEYTIRAARAGKHVLCEKPMANSVAECQQMIEACKQAGRQLMIAYRMQYEPFNREVIRMVRSGELGRVRNFVSSNGQMQRDPREWRLKRALAGGGPLPDVGIYCLNAARYITGEEPIEVSAILQRTPSDPRFTEVEEQVDFTLRFPSGVLATCATAYDVHDSKSYRVLGEQGWVDLDPGYSYRGLRMRIAREGADGKPQITEANIREKNQFALEMDHMARCVRENKRPHTPGEEGMQDMRIIAAIYEAAEAGRTVKLPEHTGRDVFRGPPP